jgi:hypothetical protein
MVVAPSMTTSSVDRMAARSRNSGVLTAVDDSRTRTAALARRLHVPVDVALTELVAQAGQWDRDRHAALQAQRQNVRPLRDRIAAHNQLPDTERWAPLARQIDPSLVRATTWPPLAAAFAEAEQAGHDLPTLLRDVLAQEPLNPSNPGLDLESRLVADLAPQPTPWRRPHVHQPDRPRNPFATQPPPRPSAPQITPPQPGADQGVTPGR